ncbi:hypothetical protein DXG01_017008 [Tephrocybe rancida]|nr:hypothetical protein DXG01_017008 [Tephrocybe rancida]
MDNGHKAFDEEGAWAHIAEQKKRICEFSSSHVQPNVTSMLIDTTVESMYARIRYVSESAIRSAISDTNVRARELDSELLSVQVEINDLMTTFETLRARVVALLDAQSNAHAAAENLKGDVSPIRILPPEIPVNIFHFAVSDTKQAASPRKALEVARVSPASRSAASGSLSLWNHRSNHGLLHRPRFPFVYIQDCMHDIATVRTPKGIAPLFHQITHIDLTIPHIDLFHFLAFSGRSTLPLKSISVNVEI